MIKIKKALLRIIISNNLFNLAYLNMKELIQKRRFNRLAEKMQKGDQGATEEIFDCFYSHIFRFFMARTTNREISEDLAQEVFLKVIRKIGTFNSQLGNFSGWIWQIARNSLTDYFREKKCLYLEDCSKNNEEFSTNDKKSFKEINDKLEVEKVFRILKKFSDKEQEIFSLHFAADLSYKTISEITGKSQGALRTLIHRINSKMKKEIK